jgi:hypothetical protein
MLVRYKINNQEASASRFNIHALDEALTGGDSVCIKDLDVWLGDSWKDMRQAFRDKDIVPDNYNERFSPPVNEYARTIGYNP